LGVFVNPSEGITMMSLKSNKLAESNPFLDQGGDSCQCNGSILSRVTEGLAR
jgi:hypothetical protein